MKYRCVWFRDKILPISTRTFSHARKLLIKLKWREPNTRRSTFHFSDSHFRFVTKWEKGIKCANGHDFHRCFSILIHSCGTICGKWYYRAFMQVISNPPPPHIPIYFFPLSYRPFEFYTESILFVILALLLFIVSKSPWVSECVH